MEKVQENFFLWVGFLLGSVGILYGKTFHYFLLLMVLFYALTNWNLFVKKLNAGKNYLLCFVAYLLYICLQTVFLDSRIGDKAHYGIFEDILLNFILVPVYVVTLKGWLTSQLLKRFLFLFCIGCVLLNTYIVFDLVTERTFVDVHTTIEDLYASRFGENKTSLLGGSLLLEPQAFHLALAALISYVMIFINSRRRMKVLYGVIFLLLLCFLSFTVTKAGLLAFLTGFVFMNIYVFRQNFRRIRLALLIWISMFIFGIFVLANFSEKYKERTDEMIVELESVKQGIYTGGTIAPRIGFVREAYVHFNEFAVWGMGVYAKDRVKDWLRNSDAGLGVFTNVHNTFLHYWIQGGIFGLGIVLFFLGAPFYNMVKRKRFSYFEASLILVIFVTSNTSILLDLNNSRLIIVLLLSMFYFYGDIFEHLEELI